MIRYVEEIAALEAGHADLEVQRDIARRCAVALEQELAETQRRECDLLRRLAEAEAELAEAVAELDAAPEPAAVEEASLYVAERVTQLLDERAQGRKE